MQKPQEFILSQPSEHLVLLPVEDPQAEVKATSPPNTTSFQCTGIKLKIRFSIQTAIYPNYVKIVTALHFIHI